MMRAPVKCLWWYVQAAQLQSYMALSSGTVLSLTSNDTGSSFGGVRQPRHVSALLRPLLAAEDAVAGALRKFRHVAITRVPEREHEKAIRIKMQQVPQRATSSMTLHLPKYCCVYDA